jgi:glycerol-3-phosphate dehydrogenase
MQRDLTAIAGRVHDLVVVGGGIQGAWIAWDAALRGLRVALVERDDFGGGTSANSLRIVHGGLRYLARGDFRRMRESIRERSALLRIAPSLVEPLPVVVPTSGSGTQSRLALGAAVAFNDLCSLDRNRGLAPERRLARGRLLSLETCQRLFPAFPLSGASGGALWYDAHLRHPERLTLVFILAAAARGAMVANYCSMQRVLSDGGKVRGIVVVDALSGREVEIAARTVVLAAGPWTGRLAGLPEAGSRHAFALNLVVGRRLATAAVGVRAPTGAELDPIIGGRRFVFLVPEGSTTLLGTWYAHADGAGTESLIRCGRQTLLEEFRGACPGLDLSHTDVLDCLWGYLPLKAGRESGRADSLAERPWIVDHGRNGGVGGMFSVEGVKYTTARHVAENVVDRVVGALGVQAGRCRTRDVRVDDPGAADLSLEARTRRAVRDEMAVRLADVVLRRIGSAGARGTVDAVATMARVAGSELGWPAERVAAEIEDVMRQIRSNGLPSESLA